MYTIKKTHLKVAAATLSLPLMLFFQNCGQAGTINVSDQGSQLSKAAAVNNQPATDTLIVDTSSGAPQGGDVPIIGVVPPSPGSPSMPPTSTPPVVVEPPKPGSSDGTVAGHSHSSCDGSKDHHDGEDKDHDKEHEEDHRKCQALDISDLLLSVKSICTGNEGHGKCGDKDRIETLALVDQNASITLDNPELLVKANKSGKVKEVMIILNANGNKILSSLSEVMDLKTPSAQTAGLKIKLSSEVNVVAGQVYKLSLVINPSEQLVSSHDKCLFKPVIKRAELVVSLLAKL